MKKFLASLLILVMAIALIPQGVFTIDVHAASPTSGTTGDCTWTLDDTVLTIRGNGSMSSYHSLSAPWGQKITHLIIESGVTSIGSYAFYGCSGLTSIIIPLSVTHFHQEVFGGCYNVKSVGYAGNETDRNNIIKDPGYHLENATWYYNCCNEDAHTYTNGCDMDCNTCQWPRAGAHTYDNSLDKDCNKCGHARTFEEFPITGISAEPITVVEGTNGSWNGTSVGNGPWVYYFKYYVNHTYTITMADGLTFNGFSHEIANLVGEYPYQSTDQSYENQWGVGAHTASVSLGSFSCQFTVTITESPIESISATPITLYENINGRLGHGNAPGISYFHYDYYDQVAITVSYKDGSTETVTYSDLDGMYSLYLLDEEQSANNPWGLGTHTGTVRYGHLSCEVDITIVPNPIEGIELVTLPKTEYVVGECFDLTGAVMRVHFNDNTHEDINISHYFTYPENSRYNCKKIHASDMITVSNRQTRDAAVSGPYFSSVGDQTLTLTYFGKSTDIPVSVIGKTIKDVSINDESKNLIVTVTYTDGTTQEMTALSFIPGAGEGTPEYNAAFGELRTDKGIYYTAITSFNDGSMCISMNDVTSNVLENGCEWYERYTMQVSYGPDFNGQITADNIDDIIRHVFLTNDMDHNNGWICGSDIRTAIMNHYAVDSIDLSLSPRYDHKNDRVELYAAGDAMGSQCPANLIYRNGYWEAYWADFDGYSYSYAHYDEEGRILRVSNGKPIIAPTPIIESISTDSITLRELDLIEYSIDKIHWQKSPVFINLNPATVYTVYQRYAASNTTISEGVTITTDSFVPGWLLEGNTWYYLNADGSVATGWVLDGNTWYYMNAGGAMQTGWVNDGGTWYYMNGSGAMMTGWVNDGGTWYYMNSSGAMQTGWLYDGAWYYLTSSGAMATGWVNDGGTWYYMNGSGTMMTGWVLDGGTWYYMNSSGAMMTGWVNDGGTWYYMNSSGAMQTGWILDGGVWYYLNASGAWVA